MQNSRVIYAPGKGTLALLRRRIPAELRPLLDEVHFDAIGLIQTSVPNVFYFADIGQKAANVTPVEILGSCPQHISTLAFLGNISSVTAAMQAVERAGAAEQKVR